jgi:hypothetical protein
MAGKARLLMGAVPAMLSKQIAKQAAKNTLKKKIISEAAEISKKAASGAIVKGSSAAARARNAAMTAELDSFNKVARTVGTGIAIGAGAAGLDALKKRKIAEQLAEEARKRKLRESK